MQIKVVSDFKRPITLQNGYGKLENVGRTLKCFLNAFLNACDIRTIEWQENRNM